MTFASEALMENVIYINDLFLTNTDTEHISKKTKISCGFEGLVKLKNTDSQTININIFIIFILHLQNTPNIQHLSCIL